MPNPASKSDPALEAAVAEAAENPERARPFAESLGVGKLAVSSPEQPARVPDREAMDYGAEAEIARLAKDLAKDDGFRSELGILLENLKDKVEDENPDEAAVFYAALWAARMFQAGQGHTESGEVRHRRFPFEAVLAGASSAPENMSPEFAPCMLDGAVDSGLAKSSGELERDDNHFQELRKQLQESLMFARHLHEVVFLQRETDASQEDRADVVLNFAAHLFRAGFLAGADARQAIYLRNQPVDRPFPERPFRGSCLTAENIDAALLRFPDAGNEFNEVGALSDALGESKEFENTADGFLRGLEGEGWIRPTTESAEAGSRGELDIFAAQMVRVGYLGAAAKLEVAKPVNEPPSSPAAPLAPPSFDQSSGPHAQDEGDESEMNYLTEWKVNPKPDTLQARALQRIKDLGDHSYTGDAICSHITALAAAPAYGYFLERHIEKFQGSAFKSDVADGWDLAAFAGEFFSAGILAKGMEFSEPGRDGLSLMIGEFNTPLMIDALKKIERGDAPWRVEEKQKHLNAFSFAHDEKFLAEINLAHFELGLEIAALEERHYGDGPLQDDYPLKLNESLTGVRKLQEAVAELNEGLAIGEPGSSEYAIHRYTVRVMRAAFEAGRRHQPADSDSKVDELVDLFRRKLGLGAFNTDLLLDGGNFGEEPYWTKEEIDAASRIVRIEDEPETYVPYYEALDRGFDDEAAWAHVKRVQEAAKPEGGEQ